MQKLTYINALSEKIEMYRGGRYILAHIDGTGSTSTKFASISFVYTSGEYITGARSLGREITAKISIDGKDRRSMYRIRQEMCDILSVDKAFDKGEIKSKLIYENDYGKWWTYGAVENDIAFQSRIKDWQRDIKLVFRCPNSFWYDTRLNKGSIEFTDKGFRLPFKFKINFGRRSFETNVAVNGNLNTGALITIYAKGEQFTLLNSKTGKKIIFTKKIPEGAVLTINTDISNLSARIRYANGDEVSAFGLISPSTPISQFQLVPGENVIKMLRNGEAGLSKIDIEWADKYVGV